MYMHPDRSRNVFVVFTSCFCLLKSNTMIFGINNACANFHYQRNYVNFLQQFCQKKSFQTQWLESLSNCIQNISTIIFASNISSSCLCVQPNKLRCRLKKDLFPFLSRVGSSASRQYAGKAKSASSPSPYSWMKTKHKRSNI